MRTGCGHHHFSAVDALDRLRLICRLGRAEPDRASQSKVRAVWQTSGCVVGRCKHREAARVPDAEEQPALIDFRRKSGRERKRQTHLLSLSTLELGNSPTRPER